MMMKNTLILLPLLLTAMVCSAQESKIEKGLRHYEEATAPKAVLNTDKREGLLQEALVCLSGSERAELILTMMEMTKVKAEKNEADSTTLYLSQARTLAKQLNMPKIEMEVLQAGYNIAVRAERWSESQQLAQSIDSLASLNPDPSERANSMFFMAYTARQNNRLDMAENFFLQALKLTENMEDRELAESTQANIYDFLSDIKNRKKEYGDAMTYFEKYEAIVLKSEKPNADLRALLMRRKLDIASGMKKRETCLQYVDSLLDLIPDIQAANMRNTTLSWVIIILNQFGESERIFSLLDQVDSKRLPAEYDTGDLLLAMKCLIEHDRKEEARILAGRLKGRIDPLLNNLTRRNTTTLFQAAYYEIKAGETESGVRHATKAIEHLISLFKDQMRTMSSDNRKTYWKQFSRFLFQGPLYAIEASRTNDEFTRTAYETLLFSKGMLLASERSVAEVIADEGTAADKELYEKLLRCNSELDALQASQSPDMEKIVSVYQEFTETDNRLAAQCSAYASIGDFANTTLDDVQKSLGPDDVLIDMTDYTLKAGGHHYAAFIITRDSKNPLLLPLCTGEAIDSVEAGASHIPNLLYQGRHAEALARVTTEALLPYLNEHGTVYLVPSGAYHQLSIEALPAPGGQLLGDRYSIVRLSSARELCTTTKAPATKPSAVLYGGLNYDVEAGEMAIESARHTLPKMLAARDGDISTLGAFAPLPHTGEEVHAIAGLLKGKAETTTCEGIHGSEESFLALSGHAPSIIHLATHGFYYSPTQALDVAALSGYQEAMDLTGLVMSGGNAGVTGRELQPGTLCGLLTASDIASLDLRGARLVCLSACHTGQGETTPEGIYGLQRALKKAGAGSILMSLWEANDESTALFMKEFYKAYASNGWDARDAFRKARTAARKEYSSPYYWAGFILLD